MPARILIVDDDLAFRELLKDYLSRLGYIPESAIDGQDAVEIMEKQDFDLALVDLDMPRMNGLEFTRHIRNDLPDFPIIIVTGYAAFYRPDEILSLDVDAFLKKPLQLSNLGDTIKRVLENKNESA